MIMRPGSRSISAALRAPVRLTATDVYRAVLGLLAVPLGGLILVRSAVAGALSPPAILLGVTFVGFGIYRTWFAIHRYRMFRAAQRDGK
jgi:hypothetical protein